MTVTCRFPIAQSAGVLAGVLAFALMAPAARAACGDYLHAAAKSTQPQSDLPVAPVPCKKCSQAPCELPAVPPATTTTHGRSPAILVAFGGVPDHPRPRFARSASDRLPADDGPNPIFHPPR